MNWYKKAELRKTDDIIYDIYKSIENNVGGIWTVKPITQNKNSKIYWLQTMLTFVFYGQDVVKQGDEFQVVVRLWIKRSADKVVHPFQGSYENASDWQDAQLSNINNYKDRSEAMEEIHRRWEALYNMTPENASIYDSERGNPLFEIRVKISGSKPSIIEEEENIEIASTNNLKTPEEIAEYVKTEINRFYFEGDDKEEVEPIDPTGGEYMEPEISFDQTEVPLLTSNFNQKMNWYKKAQFSYDYDEDRITISSPYGSIVITETYPEYEFVEDLTPEELENINIDEGDPIVKIEHIEVNPKYRGQGYGKELMKKALEEAKKRNANIIYLNASPMGFDGLPLNALTKFYENFGFTVFKEQGGNNLMFQKNANDEETWQYDENTMYDYYDTHDEAVLDQINQYNQSKPGDIQPWRLIPAPRLKKIWTDYMKFEFVRDVKGLQMIEDIIIENVKKIHANTILMEHTTLGAESFEEMYGEKLEETDERDYGDWAVDNKGSWRISDYALSNLINGTLELMHTKTPEQKLQKIDFILNVIHQRSNIAGWFVEGGSETLNEISS